MKLRTTDYIAALLLFVWIGANWDGGGVLPDILPQPPVESPFPAEGFYLLAASESSELSGVEVAINAKDLRSIPDLQRRWADFDKTQPEPGFWQDAVEWAKAKGGRQPYFVARKGDKAAEGPLEGSIDVMHETLAKAMEGLD